MLGIKLSAKKQEAMLKTHSQHMLPIVKLRLAKPQNKPLLDYFKTDKSIEEVLTTGADQLLALNAKVWSELRLKHTAVNIRDALTRTFSEQHFFNKMTKPYNAYHLCRRIGMKTCPYCNITYIPTIMVGSPSRLVTRPPLDHFFANTNYPLLAISFFNLIPACDVCNSRFKLDRPTHHLTHLNPYIGEFGDDCVFKLSGFRKIDDILAPRARSFKISLQNITGDARFSGNEKLFHLNDIYSVHHNSARDTLIKSRNYSHTTTRNIINIARSTGSDAFELIFNSCFELENLHIHPLSKLKRDIVLKYASTELIDQLKI